MRKCGRRDKKDCNKNPHASKVIEMSECCTIWLVNSGASLHIFNDRAVFMTFSKKEKMINVRIGDDSTPGVKYYNGVDGLFMADFGT